MENAGNGRNVIFRGVLVNIQENVANYSGECPQTFQGMSSNIPGNVSENSEECCQENLNSKFQRFASGISENRAVYFFH